MSVQDEHEHSNAQETNRAKYDQAYQDERRVLRYPADWVIRFHAYYLRRGLPSGRVLDYGCGSGNNARFFADRGYEVWGLDVSEAVRPRYREVVGSDACLKIVSPTTTVLPYATGFFDLVVANQALYYLADEGRIRAVIREFYRVLRPGGVMFATLMGLSHYYLTCHAVRMEGGVWEVAITEPGHRLFGQREIVVPVRDATHLHDLFVDFEPMTIGHYDFSMFDVPSAFHWLYAGRRPDRGHEDLGPTYGRQNDTAESA